MPKQLRERPIHLGATAVVQPEFTGDMAWYMAYGAPRRVVLGPGEFAINDPGVWHTADVDAPATALFITAGVGTEVRPR
jgi:hypothetical protein